MSNLAIACSKLDHGAPVELFVLDMTRLGGGVMRFAPQVNELGAAIVWQGQTFQPFPIEASGFDQAATGPFPRPRLRVSNVLGLLAVQVQQYDGLRGATVIRKQTLATYLDAVNFAAGNPLADPLAEFPDEVWRIDRTVDRNKATIEWELANPLDVTGVMLPGRVVNQSHCNWLYRGADCGYQGGPVARGDDTPTNDLAQDRCSHRPSGCRLRFGSAAIPGGFFPGVGSERQG